MSDRWETLLEQDWAEAWDTLPDAPALVARPKTAQITLRVPRTLLTRIKRVALARSLPYHALARAWIIDSLQNPDVAESPSSLDAEAHTEQLNIKLDQAVLDDLKRRGHELRQPYHRLAREFLEHEVRVAEQALGFDSTPVSLPPIKELMVLLLHATNSEGESTIRGMTRLQKLLFVVEQKLASQSSFYAFNYGPFNDEVNDAARALEVAGFTRTTGQESAGTPTFDEMMATVARRATSESSGNVVEFALNDRGHEAAENLRKSAPVYEQLFAFVESIKREWDTPDLTDLIERVYDTWPEFAENSLIREEIERRKGTSRRSHS